MNIAVHTQLLDTFPLVRARSIEETSDRIGRVFSPHRLEVRGKDGRLDVVHNRVRLRDVSLNVLHYGAEVVIDSGERGDFFLVRLPLGGRAQFVCAQGGSQRRPRSPERASPRSRAAWCGAATAP